MDKLTDVDTILIKNICKHFKHSPLTHYKCEHYVQYSDPDQPKRSIVSKIWKDITIPILMVHIDKNISDFLSIYQQVVIRLPHSTIHSEIFNRICFYKLSGYYEPMKTALLNCKLSIDSLTVRILNDLMFFYTELPHIVRLTQESMM